MLKALVIIFLTFLAGLCPSVAAANTNSPRAILAAQIVTKGEKTWQLCQSNTPVESLSSRWVFGYALALCEAQVHPERLETLFTLASAMQDQDPKSRQHGNFRWYWRDARVLDANAVDFCMRAGALLWLHHTNWMPTTAKAKLLPILQTAAKGLTAHKVKPSYSNIALMNAADHLLLGQALRDTDLIKEGKERLDGILEYTRENGIHEYVSPTYTGVDLECLGLIEAYAPDARTRNVAQALLRLWWTDTALNFYPPSGRLAGTHSRTYDFLSGLGLTDVSLSFHGWLDRPLPADPEVLYTMFSRWQVPEAIARLTNQFPRLVRQRWGEKPWHSRTHYLMEEVTLSVSAAVYGGWMDMPLTVDFPGDRESLRGYFIADARNDPYGKSKVPRGAHAKAFHVDPFWTAVQAKNHALALVIYRPSDVPTNAVCLESSLVLPVDDGDFRVGKQLVSLKRQRVTRTEVGRGEVVSLRRGKAAIAARVLWTANTGGEQAKIALVNDGNEYGAARLVIEHADAETLSFGEKAHPGAIFWITVGGGLNTDEDWEKWLTEFASAEASVTSTKDSLAAETMVAGYRLKLEAAAPWTEPGTLEPSPTEAILELNGKDIGAGLLEIKP